MYLVGALKEKLDIVLLGQAQKVPLVWADGMIGAIPVFETRAAAETYANGHFEVIELQEKQKEPLCKFTSPS